MGRPILKTRLGRSITHTACALIAVEVLVFFFYMPFGPERLIEQARVTGAMAVAVSLPLFYWSIGQNMKLAEATRQLRRLSRLDQMTGLYNRTTFLSELDAVFASARGASEGAFLFIDADEFKRLNDTHGHLAGDRALMTIGAAIRSAIRESDLACRLGGEEFGVFLFKADRAVAITVAERIRRTVRDAPADAEIGERPLSVSIGVAVHRSGMGVTECMTEADRNLYKAKESGRNCVVVDLTVCRAA